MKTLKLNILRCSVMCVAGETDTVFIYPDIETPFPEMKYAAVFEMKVKKGYGVEYCQKVLGLEPKVINL
jgi:hypothetical protein